MHEQQKISILQEKKVFHTYKLCSGKVKNNTEKKLVCVVHYHFLLSFHSKCLHRHLFPQKTHIYINVCAHSNHFI